MVHLNAIGFDDLTVVGTGVNYLYDGRIVTVIWDAPFAAGEKRVIEVKYNIIEPVTWRGFIIF